MSEITRRQFINGTLVAAGASMLPIGAGSQAAMAALAPSYYPPALTGLRGNHPGSHEQAHGVATGEKPDWRSSTDLKEEYDLVVVGGGLSGLAAAYIYQQKHGRDKKVLILDNHDEFGGHARRNEHTIDGNTRLTYGGTQNIMPSHGGKTELDLLKDVGVDLKRFDEVFDKGFFKRNGLGAVMYFDKETFGEDKVVKHPFCNHPNYVHGLPMGELSHEEAAQQAPLSENGKKELLRVLKGTGEGRGSYYNYLKKTLGVTDPKIMIMARNSALDWSSTGTDTMGIGGARGCGAMGFPPKAEYDPRHPYIHHYPDGVAGVTRAFVKKMIPQVAKGKNAEELVLAKFNYAELDKPSNTVRIRLNSTAVNVQHAGDPKTASEVLVNYVNDKKLYQVKGKGVVMACYNMMIPHIVPNLPEKQDAALRSQTKSVVQYTSVGLRNWRAIKEIGLGFAMCPGSMHQSVKMDFPVSMGGYEYTKTPDDPCCITMIGCTYGTEGAPVHEQLQEARYTMLGLEFKDYEDAIRKHLSGMLPKKLFKFDRDVVSISVNRWAHGYPVGGSREGRRPFGRITIANCDSAPGADAMTAIAMAYRAVNELG